jgi:hypothetical protein
MPVDEDHSNLVKFGADNQDCQAIMNFIHEAVEEASTRLQPDEGTSSRRSTKTGRSKTNVMTEDQESGRFIRSMSFLPLLAIY